MSLHDDMNFTSEQSGQVSADGGPAAKTGLPETRSIGLGEIVIVDTQCERYAEFVRAAEAGEIGLHFCVDGRSAMRLSRRFRADAWLVAAELPDMSGLDLISMLAGRVMQSEVDPLVGGSRISLDHLGEGMRSGVFLVADSYRLEDEQQALAAGVAGYLISPVALELIRGSRLPVPVTADTCREDHPHGC